MMTVCRLSEKIEVKGDKYMGPLERMRWVSKTACQVPTHKCTHRKCSLENQQEEKVQCV